ncbi:hypothetical protein LSTR_LSTR007929 [Laodelphax striatellus]|uniref:Uncharacterized protein n=1 Tax=Laodelphax striatellus TaxID=195883 RepID=A0A482XKF5_LAOST|nr:hypothetical protein LSTR_LSTR007929 [Laodelphax striatellus]
MFRSQASSFSWMLRSKLKFGNRCIPNSRWLEKWRNNTEVACQRRYDKHCLSQAFLQEAATHEKKFRHDLVSGGAVLQSAAKEGNRFYIVQEYMKHAYIAACSNSCTYLD